MLRLRLAIAAGMVGMAMMPLAASARTFDVSITRAGVTFVPAAFFLGDHVRVYAQVENLGDRDVEGNVFFSENGTAIGTPPPFSSKARGASEEVWVDWQPAVEGDRQLTIRVVTTPDTHDEDTTNNEMIVPVTIDRDTDHDGIGDRTDTDDDNDGLPDDWEIAHGLNPLDPSDANLDPDGDGRTTIQEYRAGTDPFHRDAVAGGGGGTAGGVSAGSGGSGSAPTGQPSSAVVPSVRTPAAPRVAPVRKGAAAATRGGVVAGVKLSAPREPSAHQDAIAFAPPDLPKPEPVAPPDVNAQLDQLLGKRGAGHAALAPILAAILALACAAGILALAIRRSSPQGDAPPVRPPQ